MITRWKTTSHVGPHVEALQQTKPGFVVRKGSVFPSDNDPLGGEPEKAVWMLRPAPQALQHLALLAEQNVNVNEFRAMLATIGALWRD